MSIESMLNKKAQIIKYSEKSIGWNVENTILETITVDCRFKILSSRNIFVGAKDMIIPTARIYLKADTLITQKDKIKYKENLYEIVSPINNAGSRDKLLQLDLRIALWV